ncbi:MAG: SDR family NAD(P)-dependent oxidoreductase [Candidatus Methanomethylophilaceae archaeon]|nr:SDR family NAD(P)-dependent oxidoreductase [Candidatus Methanomethylophilaceae archaeon]
MEKQVILITGASSGIGYETAEALAKMGHMVYGAARRTEKIAPLEALGVVPIKMDVTDEKSLQAGVQAILEKEGRIDILINNAGYGSLGAIETVPIEEARRQMEVNVFAIARLTQLVLPGMRAKRHGRIINISSLAGKMTIPFGGWYNISKYSVEAFSDALRMETRPFGIKASATAVFPRPSMRLIAAGFLSEHMFPDTETIVAPVAFSISLQTASEAMVAMFMPMASPVENDSLR